MKINTITCSKTRAINDSYVFYRDLNNSRIQFGGRTLEILDANAGLAAAKFRPQRDFVTAGYDHVHFLTPLTQSDLVTCVSYVTGAKGKVIEVFTKIIANDTFKDEQKIAFTSFCSLVVKADEVSFKKLIPESSEEKYLTSTFAKRQENRQNDLAYNKELVKHLTK